MGRRTVDLRLVGGKDLQQGLMLIPRKHCHHLFNNKHMERVVNVRLMQGRHLPAKIIDRLQEAAHGEMKIFHEQSGAEIILIFPYREVGNLRPVVVKKILKQAGWNVTIRQVMPEELKSAALSMSLNTLSA